MRNFLKLILYLAIETVGLFFLIHAIFALEGDSPSIYIYLGAMTVFFLVISMINCYAISGSGFKLYFKSMVLTLLALFAAYPLSILALRFGIILDLGEVLMFFALASPIGVGGIIVALLAGTAGSAIAIYLKSRYGTNQTE